MIFPDHIEAAFEELAEKLQVPPSHRESAERSYHSVGEWLDRPDSSLQRHQPQVYPQGSFPLGTAIRPVTSENEYDVDVVCQLNGLSTAHWSQAKLKQAVGEELVAYARAYSLQNEPEEKRRCWTLNYANGAQFHMDILPAVPNASFVRDALLKDGVDVSQFDLTDTAIAITDQKSHGYRMVTQDWPVSNPKGYLSWFKSRMGTPIGKARMFSAAEPLPDHRARTPLQLAIQILKRHRDLMFEDISDEGVDPDDKPISIILTTLAAHAYRQETTISGALGGILSGMDCYIEGRDGDVWIANPSYPLENFADRWRENPRLQQAFDRWLERARRDFREVVSALSKSAAEENLQGRFDKPSGRDVVLANSWTGQERKAAKNQLGCAPHKHQPRWPSHLQGAVKIKRALFVAPDCRKTTFKSDDSPLPKECKLRFHAETTVPKPYEVHWQVTNSGEEAAQANQLRGNIFPAKTAGEGGLRQNESTAYRGSHSIECFIVKGGFLVARSGSFIVNIQ